MNGRTHFRWLMREQFPLSKGKLNLINNILYVNVGTFVLKLHPSCLIITVEGGSLMA